MNPVFFKSPIEFRAWLRKNCGLATELWVGFYKISSVNKGIRYAEALDEALCYGWIDAVRKKIDKNRWTIRFTPRKSPSIWSVVNIKHVKRLIKLGRMKPSGLQAFHRRDKEKSKIYSYEVRERPLEPKYAKRFKADAKAWEYFCSQVPSYQKVARWWIISRFLKNLKSNACHSELVSESIQFQTLKHLPACLDRCRQAGVQGDERLVFPHPLRAKRHETRIRRLDSLIEASRNRQKLNQFLSKK